jgi:hypothetical protein
MRAVLATVMAALAVAAPAAAVNIGKEVSGALHVGSLAQVKTGQDKTQTCQAGTRSGKQRSTVVGNTRRPDVVACEQPPRSNLLTPDSVAKATAAALAVLG